MTNDTDGDGIVDYFEKNGMYLPNCGLIKTDYQNPDTDGDGLLDGEEIDTEMIQHYTGMPSDVVSNQHHFFLYCSYPDRVDSDGDGVQDWDESLLNRLIYNEFAFVLFDNEDFSRQGNDEGKLLKTANPDLEVRILSINNKSEFTKYWNLYSGINADISLIFHGSTNYLWIVDDELMKEEISSLQTARIKTLRLLSCNGGHKDVEDNFAETLLKHHYIDHLYAMDGSISYYPSIIGSLGFGEYAPRLSVDQSGFYKKASQIRVFAGPNVGYIYIKRNPIGLYEVVQ